MGYIFCIPQRVHSHARTCILSCFAQWVCYVGVEDKNVKKGLAMIKYFMSFSRSPHWSKV